MKTSRTFIALVLCTCSASAFAQSTDVQITGRILPVACNLQPGTEASSIWVTYARTP